jgi:hypothetical protein
LIKYKYFPYAPGLRYPVENGFVTQNFEVPSYKLIFSKEIHSVCLGGYFENLYNLYLINSYKINNPNCKIFHISEDKYNELYHVNQNSKKSIYDMDWPTLNSYPVPVFFDKSNGKAFINSMFSVYVKQEQFVDFIRFNKEPIIKSMWKNSFVNYDYIYKPNFNFSSCYNLEKYLKSKKYNKNNTVVIFPDYTDSSYYYTSYLDWNINDVKVLSQLLNSIGYNLLVFTKNPKEYSHINCILPEFNYVNITYILNESNFVISEELCFILSSMILNKSHVFSKGSFDNDQINKTKEYLNSKEVLIKQDLEPVDVYNFILKS